MHTPDIAHETTTADPAAGAATPCPPSVAAIPGPLLRIAVVVGCAGFWGGIAYTVFV